MQVDPTQTQQAAAPSTFVPPIDESQANQVIADAVAMDIDVATIQSGTKRKAEDGTEDGHKRVKMGLFL
jgi:hypothetical protein